MFKNDSRIFIAGVNNITGAALLRRLKEDGFVNVIDRPRLDLMDEKLVGSFFEKEKPEYCFLTSVKEGGIEANIDYPADLIYQNLAVQSNVIHSAYKIKVKKLIFFASSCIYPKNCPQPMKEEYILTARPEKTNEPYAVAKIAGINMCQAYNRQYKTNFISVIPATVYGPNDNFDSKTSHVIPALIGKFHEAKLNKKNEISIWGTGKPRREFIYVDDLVDASLYLMKKANVPEIINVGTGVDISIYDLAKIIKRKVDFEGEIILDHSKPDGAMIKLLDSKALNNLKWKPSIDLLEGIENVYRWYLKYYGCGQDERGKGKLK